MFIHAQLLFILYAANLFLYREMFLFLIMVTDEEKFACCSTDVSSLLNGFCIHDKPLTGANNGSNLEKVEFATIINGKLVYDNGESDSTVFAGLVTYEIATAIYVLRKITKAIMVNDYFI